MAIIHIKINDLTIENCEAIFDIIFSEHIKNEIRFDIENYALSHAPHDNIPEPADILEFFTNYFNGVPIKLGLSGISDLSQFSILQRIDLLYRTSSDKLYETFIELPPSVYIKSRRAYAIAKKMLFNDILDFFVENHTIEWFAFFEASNFKKAKDNLLISDDKSAKIIGSNYYIHQGTNYWNRAWLTTNRWDDRWDKQFVTWQNQLYKFEQRLAHKAVLGAVALVIPEKDTLARFEGIDFSSGNMLPSLFVNSLSVKLKQLKFIYPVVSLLRKNHPLRFMLPDSHLTAHDYWVIFCEILESLQLSSFLEHVSVDFILSEQAGDLSYKFKNFQYSAKQLLSINFKGCAQPVVVSGASEFASPLRNSHVVFSNPSPLINKTVLLMGDSHCSIGSNPYLTYMFSSIFSEVSFYWDPFLINNMLPDSDSTWDIVIGEISERFVCPRLL